MAANVRVPFDQWLYSSGVRRRATKLFQELADFYLRPAMQAIARGGDSPIF